MIELAVAVAFVLVVSAVCSLFEAVLYAVPVSHIESLAQEGRLSGRILRRLRREVDRPIAAILSLNTIANTAGAALAGAAAARVLGLDMFVWFSAGLTLSILIFSEVIPKTAGVVYHRSLAPLIAAPLQGLVWAFTPLIWLCRLTTRLISRKRTDEHSVSDKEIIVMARLGLKAGTIDADEAKVIENILVLESKKASDVMTPRSVVFALPAKTTVAEARRDPRVFAHSRIPVYDESVDGVVGKVHRHQILTAVADDKTTMTIEELMKPVHFVAETIPLDKLLKHFLERRQHLFVVLDEHGGTAGVIALEDVLEEILGKEIVDETDAVADLRVLAQKRRRQILDNL